METLPRGNQVLLKYIMCILHHIANRSDTNMMTSVNLAICLGPSLLWCDPSDSTAADMESASKTVPNVVQALLDNVTQVFGDEVIDLFGHPPIAPVESDDADETEEAPPSGRRMHASSYNNSLESLSDGGEAPPAVSLTQMSPSSCSRDSGLILSDPHEDTAEHSDNLSLRQPSLVKSKSCDSLTPSQPLAPLQTQVSSDSLDCDDEYIELGSNFRSYLLTKSASGAHLSYDKNAEQLKHQPVSTSRLKERLAHISSQYTENSPKAALPAAGEGYSSSDSDSSR